MQWDKVKNLLIIILCIINLFLAAIIGIRLHDTYQQEKNLLADIAMILSRFDIAAGPELRIPSDQRLIMLEAERERAAEEAFAVGLLGQDVQTQYHENGEVSFGEGENWVVWMTDGAVDAVFEVTDSPGDSQKALENWAKQVFAACGVAVNEKLLAADAAEKRVVLYAAFSGVPVYGMELVLQYEGAGQARLSGKWCFSELLAQSADRARVYSASDALMQFVLLIPEINSQISRIDVLELGYEMTGSATGKIQMVPVWKINTDKGVFLFDPLKNLAEEQVNMA